MLQCDTFVVFVLSDKPRQKQGRGLVYRKLDKASHFFFFFFFAGRPEAALLFWFFDGFRSSVGLCAVILARYKNRE